MRITLVVIAFVSQCSMLAQAQWVNPPSKSQLEASSGLRHRMFRSNAMKTDVGFCVSLPAGYEGGTTRHPVVYWLHGGGGHESCNLFVGKAWRNKDSKSKPAVQPIIVFPAAFRSGYMDHYDGKVMLETMIIKELVPLIDKDYRTVASRKGRAVHGFSMGSSGALKFATKYPDLFCSAVAWGGGAINLETTQDKWILDILQLNLNGDLKRIRETNTYYFVKQNKDRLLKYKTPFLLICGRADSWHKSALTFHEHLQQTGLNSRLILVDDVKHSIGDLHKAQGDVAIKFQQEVFASQTGE